MNTQPSEQEILEQMNRLLQGSELRASERSRKILEYVVRETLAGQAGRIKAYTIAIEVLGRGPQFDPQNDPIVRMEAQRLRRSLDLYYLVEGQNDPVLISIPKGSYVPVFSYRTDNAAAEAVSRPPEVIDAARHRRMARAMSILAAAAVVVTITVLGWSLSRGLLSGGGDDGQDTPALNSSKVPVILVMPLSDLGGEQASLLARGMTEDLITQLSRFKEIAVMGRETSWSVSPQATDADAGRATGADYVTTGSIQEISDRLRVTARLLDAARNTVLWSQTFDDDLTSQGLLSIQESVVKAVTTAVAQPYGIVYTSEARRNAQSNSNLSAGYKCILEFYGYRAVLSAEKHASTRDCLEQVTRASPSFATGWAMLSYVYLDEYRFDYNPESGTSPALERATRAAQQAIRLEPDNLRALQSLMVALFFQKRIDESLAIGAKALSLNPNDTELLAEYGTRLAVGKDWAEGEKLIKQALARNPGHSGYYHAMLALTAAMQEDYPRALTEIRMADLGSFPLFRAIEAGIYGRLGMETEAKEAVQRLLALDPNYGTKLPAAMDARSIRTVDRAEMFSNVRKAGLPLHPTAQKLADLWDQGKLTKPGRYAPDK